MVHWVHPTLHSKWHGILISSAIFAGLTTVTDRQTDRPCYSVHHNRPHLSSTAM